MTTWGANPEKKVAPELPAKRRQGRFSDPMYLVSYFVHHPKATMSQVVTADDRKALGATFRRLRDNRDMSVEDITKAIDAFYVSPAGGVPHPALSLLSQLLVDKNAVQWGKLKDPVIREFARRGFERTPQMRLPWPVEDDQDIKRRVMYDPEHLLDIIQQFSEHR